MDNGRRALSQGREAGAGMWFSDAVREAERLDPRSEQLAASLRSLAELYRRQGRQRDAEALDQRIAAVAPIAPLSSIVTALQDYAALLRADGRERDAAVLDREIQGFRAVGSGGSRDDLLFFSLVAELRSYAQALRRRHRMAEAQSVEALASAEAQRLMSRYAELRRRLSAESASAASSLTWEWQTQAAFEALDARLYPEAEDLFADAVKTAEAFPSPDVRLAHSLSALAFTDRAQAKRDEFTAAEQRAMSILERAAGSRHSALPQSLALLALAHLRFELEPVTTIAQLERALAILKKDVAADHPVVGLHMAGLAASYLALAQPAQAKPCLDQALAIAQQQYRKDQVPVAIGLMKVVDVYWDRGEYTQAHEVAQRVIASLTRIRPPNHPDIIVAIEADRLLVQKLGRAGERVSLASRTVVPIEVAGNAMLVRARVNRSQGALMLIDTGASSTVIRPLLLARLGISVGAEAPRHTLTVPSGSAIEVPFVTLTVQVGDATVENLDVGVFDAMPNTPDLDGFLGADFLQRFKVTLERQARQMILEPLPR